MEWIVSVIEALAKLAPQTRTRIVACTAFLMATCMVLASFGVTPVYPGFARADMMESLVKSMRDMRSDTIANSILSMRAEECQVKEEGAKRLYSETISKDMLAYQKVTGMQFPPLADCRDE